MSERKELRAEVQRLSRAIGEVADIEEGKKSVENLKVFRLALVRQYEQLMKRVAMFLQAVDQQPPLFRQSRLIDDVRSLQFALRTQYSDLPSSGRPISPGLLNDFRTALNGASIFVDPITEATRNRIAKYFQGRRKTD